jgi:hypothetical protein
MLHSLLQFSPEEMTYKELLQQLSEEQLNQDVALISEDDLGDYHLLGLELVFVTDEYGIVHPHIRF